MKKHVILALNSNLDSKLEQYRNGSFVAEHTLQDVDELQNFTKDNHYFKPDDIIISADLKSNPKLVDYLLQIKKIPATKDSNILLFTDEINDSDIEMVKKIGSLIAVGIYPILATPDFKSVLNYIDHAPDMTDRLTAIYKKYKKLQKQSASTVVEEDEDTDFELDGPAKIISFNQAKPGDGKNFILSNYAMTLSNYLSETRQDKKILIVDFDNRNSDLSAVLSLVETDTDPLFATIKAAKRYTTQIRLKNNKKSDEKKKLYQTFEKDVLKSAQPLGGRKNLSIIAHTDDNLDKLTDLNATEAENLLEILKKHYDILLFNFNAESLNFNGFQKLFQASEIIYSIITMNRKDINMNLALNQEYMKQGVDNRVRYILNKYPDESYNEQLGQPTTTELLFDKDIISSYNLNVTNIIPFIYPSILFNESFSGVLLANEQNNVVEYPKMAFKMMVQDSGYNIEVE